MSSDALLPILLAVPGPRASSATPRSARPVTADERRLLDRAGRGDDRAFAQLVRLYQDRVFGLCLRMMGSREEAEDLTQEVFVSIHGGLRRFRGEASLSTWIYRVARNHCLNRIKYLGRRPGRGPALDHVPEAQLARWTDAPPAPDAQLEGVQMQSLLEAALMELPEEQRLLVLLRDVDGLSYDEICEICELPVGTVKSRLHRARAVLARRVLEAQGEPAGPEGGDAC